MDVSSEQSLRPLGWVIEIEACEIVNLYPKVVMRVGDWSQVHNVVVCVVPMVYDILVDMIDEANLECTAYQTTHSR